MKLNAPQQQAVDHTDGALLIIAGAGSGKTRVLTERLVRILGERRATPEECLVVTFTNKAAGELRARVLERLDEEGHRFYGLPWLGTFHSVCVRLLRREGQHLGLSTSFSILDADDQLALMKQVFEKLSIDDKHFNPRAALGGISSAKNELITPEQYAQHASGYFQENVALVYGEYQRQLRKSGALDFDDLLVYSVRLLEDVPEVGIRYREQFKYIFVDEYQDTNHVQYRLLKFLSEGHGNICVVGDDDQSIYAWRGATIRNILEFERDFSDATVIKLEQNYRSTQKILAAGNSVVKVINKRKPKELWTNNGEGEQITVYNALDERDESLWVAQTLSDAIREEGIPASELAVLYRMNAQSRLLEESLLRAGIPYRIVGNVRFYERKEVKDALAYLRVIYNPADPISVLRVINVPARKIGAKTIGALNAAAESENLSLGEYLFRFGAEQRSGIGQFSRLIQQAHEFAHTHNVTELLNFLLNESGYLAQLRASDSEENRQRLENLQELINVTSKYNELAPQASLQAFLEEVALQENSTAEELKGPTGSLLGDAISAEQGRVTLMTVHSAKGLEFGRVIVVGLEEGLFPHARSLQSSSEIDEERRLAYVAITRAKTKLFLSYAQARTVFGSRNYTSPSRFLEDIDSNLIEFHSFGEIWRDSDGETWKSTTNKTTSATPKPRSQFHVNAGEKVRHQHFGIGTVMSIDEEYIKVRFPSGVKELATEYAQLQKV